MASGSIVGWLNADDVYLPGALRAVGEAFAARPEAEWATGRCRIIDGDGQRDPQAARRPTRTSCCAATRARCT